MRRKKKKKEKKNPKTYCIYCKSWLSSRKRKKDVERNKIYRYCDIADKWVSSKDTCKSFTMHNFIICPIVNGSRFYSACLRKLDFHACKKCTVGDMVRFFRPLKRFQRRKILNDSNS